MSVELQEQNAIASMIDRRLQIKLEMDRLKEELAKLDEEIKAEHEPGEILLGSEGYGYKLSINTKLVHGNKAIRFLKTRDLLEEFASVSTTGLEKLVKAGRLDKADLELLKEIADREESIVLRSYVPEEAKVV